jgi:hypothetical protein
MACAIPQAPIAEEVCRPHAKRNEGERMPPHGEASQADQGGTAQHGKGRPLTQRNDLAHIRCWDVASLFHDDHLSLRSNVCPIREKDSLTLTRSTRPALVLGVTEIIALGAKPQMRRVAARGIIASVTDDEPRMRVSRGEDPCTMRQDKCKAVW